MPTRSELLAHDLIEAVGRPAVFLHALLGHRQFMGGLAEWWRISNGSTLLIDLPGHGENPAPASPISIANSAGEIRRVVQAAGLEKPVLIGHSMGALVALEIAARHSDEVAAVILLDPAPVVLDLGTRSGWEGLLDMLQGDGYEEAKKILIDAQSGPYDDKTAVAGRAAIMEKIDPDTLIQSFASMLAWDGGSALPRISVPVAGFWAGRNSEPEVLLAHQPGAFIGQVIASGHYVHLEAADQVVAMINRCMEVWKL